MAKEANPSEDPPAPSLRPTTPAEAPNSRPTSASSSRPNTANSERAGVDVEGANSKEEAKEPEIVLKKNEGELSTMLPFGFDAY